MILIADSGSTKTAWKLQTGNGRAQLFYTDGINPAYQSTEDIHQTVAAQLLPQLAPHWWIGPITLVQFYGAGCANDALQQVVAEALRPCFKHAEIEVASDLLGAARGVCNEQPGIACILGTGSNSCYFDGQRIVRNVSPMGFILGDEGSGAVLGKNFLHELFKGHSLDDLREDFLSCHNLTVADIIQRVYKQPFPNRFLASFAPYLHQHKDHKAIHQLVVANFCDFIERNILEYPEAKELPIHFVGSIAYHFQDELREALSRYNLHLGNIRINPL